MVASSVLCDLMPQCFVICDRRDRGVDSVLYTVHASEQGSKRRDVAFFYSFNQSINQSIRELRFHPFGVGNTVHNGSHDYKSYFHIWLHIVDALNRTTWFCSCAIYTNLNYIDLKNYSIKISKKEVILPRGRRGRFLIFRGYCPGGLLICSPTCHCFTKPIRVPHEVEQRQKQHMVKLKKMREKRIQQRVK